MLRRTNGQCWAFIIEIRNSLFENCTFHNCNFENACLIDVVFQYCDLSNSKFTGSYFERCKFEDCKCIGINMSDTVVKQATFEHSKLQYSCFDQTKVSDVRFDHVDFSESSMAEAKLKRFEATGSRFVKNNLFKTSLEKVDFTGNEFVAPMVSMPPIELYGAIICTTHKFITSNLTSLLDLESDGDSNKISQTFGDAKFTLKANKSGEEYSTFELYITAADIFIS